SGRACRVLLVGGGTGGHVSPLLAVAEALTEKDPETLFLFIGGRRGLEAELVAGSGIPFHATAMPSLRDPDSRFSLVSRAAVMPIAMADAPAQILRFKPNVCCTTGGLASFPVVVAARLARVPVYIWEGNAIPGRVNRMLAACRSGSARRSRDRFASSRAVARSSMGIQSVARSSLGRESRVARSSGYRRRDPWSSSPAAARDRLR